VSYYTGRGDYYSGKGDPGFASILGKVIGGVGKVASAVLPGVGGAIGSVASAASKALGGTKSVKQLRGAEAAPAIPTPGVRGQLERFLPGGASGYQCAASPCAPGWHLDKTKQEKCVRNRKTNYANPRALSRATKRLDGFVTVARRAMKSTNYKVVSKSYKQNWRKPLKR